MDQATGTPEGSPPTGRAITARAPRWGSWRRLALAATAVSLSASSVPVAFGKHLDGRVLLEPKHARVVTKFCFDFKKAPPCNGTEGCLDPGHLTIDFFAGSEVKSGKSDEKAEKAEKPEIHVALLDDEYFSFPEVSEVMADVNCKDIGKAAKRSFTLNWANVVNGTREGAHEITETRIVEKIRPRWWYVAIVSCAGGGVELSYHMHFVNNLRGWQSELSMDAQGVTYMALLQSIFIGGVAFLHSRSAREWSSSGRSGRCLRLHPAVMMVTVAVAAGALGSLGWLLYFTGCQQSGLGSPTMASVGRVSTAVSRTAVSVLLMLFARGQVICRPDLEWREHKETVLGLVVFGFLSFWLETWGDSELRSMSTEYIYDTRPGTALVALDLLWLYLYATRCWATWQAETRTRPRLFFKRYAFPFTLWFASLPLVALVATFLAPWVRFKITFAVNAATLVAALGALVYTFQPTVAPKLYELSAHEYEPVNDDELANFLKEDDEEDL